MQPLSRETIDEKIEDLSGWTYNEAEKYISKTFEFDTFTDAVNFTHRVAAFAEEVNHHPDITISYTKVLLTLTTHESGGVTDRDMQFAKRIEESIKPSRF